MSDQDFYMNLPSDLSGSISKNRFRHEIFYGLELIFEKYRTKQEFCVIFDYVCDIEVHMKDEFEFYQIKTNKNHKPYTIKSLIEKSNKNNSIIGKLFLIKEKAEGARYKVSLAIVANVPLKDNKKMYSSYEKIEISKLKDESLDYLKESIKQELSLEKEICLENISYIYTSMDLYNPQDSLLGKTIKFFNDVKGCDPKKTQAFYNLLTETITQKASEERKFLNLKELRQAKGINREELDRIMDKYVEYSDISVEKAYIFIEANYKKINERQNLKKALAQIALEISNNDFLKKIECDIVKFYKDNISRFDVDMCSAINIVIENFEKEIPVEYDNFGKIAIILLILTRLEENYYE